MAKARLINCDFMNNMTKVSNKAKLLYYTLFVNGDDRGFIGNSDELIKVLETQESGYKQALQELVESGLIYEFSSNHDNKVYLIRHWYYHNKYRPNLWTNYIKYLQMVELIDNEYALKEKPFKGKEIKVNENKLNESKLNENKEVLPF